MNTTEAKELIRSEVDNLRSRPYAVLRKMIGDEPITGERTGPSGEQYQVEIRAFWDSRPDGNIRVQGIIDESPHKSVFWNMPILRWIPIYTSSVTHDFIKSPSDEFVGE
jgi:hypothetical protein